MLVARLRDSWETPSRPAMELDRTVVPPARFMNSELMIFLQETHRCRKPFSVIRPVTLDSRPVSGLLLGVLQEAHGIDGGRILLGIVQPAAGVVLYPVGAVTVAQQEMVGLFAL